MNSLIHLKSLSEVLNDDIGEQWSARYYTGHGSRIITIVQPHKELAVKRLRVDKSGDWLAWPWTVSRKQLLRCLADFQEDLLLDVRQNSQNHQLYSFIVKLSVGQISFYGGRVYLRKISDRVGLQQELAKLDKIFKL